MPLLLLIVMLAQLPAAAGATAPAQTGLIAGRVIDAVTGQPVTGVMVTLNFRPAPGQSPPATTGSRSGGPGTPAAPPSAPPRPKSVLVDGSGRFVFTALAAGTYDVAATKRGYAPGAIGRLRIDGATQPVLLPEHGRRTDAVIRVWKHASIAGTVVDEVNEPMVGIIVHALRRDWVAGESRLSNIGTAATDDRGAYRLGSLPAGDYLIGVPSSANTVPAAALQANGGPNVPQNLRDAVIRVASIPQPMGSREQQRVGDLILHGATNAITQPEPGADGRLLVYPMAFHPAAPGGNDFRLLALASGEARTLPPIQLRPEPAVRVSGVITGAEGAPITTLTLVPVGVDGFTSETGFQAARSMTDGAGAFTFLGVTPGTYRLRATSAVAPPPPPGFAAPDYVPARMPTYWLNETVTVGSRDLALSLALKPALSVSGRLVFDGQRPPPRQDQITRDIMSAAPADGRSINTLTGRSLNSQNFGFEIGELAGGRYLLRQAGSVPTGWTLKSITIRGQDAIDVPFDLTENLGDVVVTFTDRPSAINGIVRTSSGEPDLEALVISFPVDPTRWVEVGRTPMRLRTTRTTATGSYYFGGTPPGEYYVAAVHDSVGSSWQSARFLEALSRLADRVRVTEGVQTTQELKRVEIK